MLQILNFAEANNALRPFYNNSRTPYTLDAMHSLMEYLGNPQEQIRVVHVAGTSGKTSTSYYCSALLNACGKTTGLFVSPHVDEVNERLQINGSVLAEAEYCAVLSEFLNLIKDCSVQPSYFELLAAFALWEFARRNLDFAVMEVGLGGLLDATNIVQRADKVCLITDIGLDHTEILGDTIEAIAAQKAGIIQTGNQVYMHQQQSKVMDVVYNHITKKQATLVIAVQTESAPIDLPLFQQRNLSLAATAVGRTLHKSSAQMQDAVTQASQVTVPARLEKFTVQNKTLIVDGSHNEQKMTTMATSLRDLYGQTDVAVLCAFIEGNQQRWQGGLRILLQTASYIIFTTFQGGQDTPKSSIEATEIIAFCEQQGFNTYEIIEQPGAAYERMLERPEELLLITGSFYLLNHVRPRILQSL